ncbi:serine/threonine protein kinase [bacterium]|nr:serine/threonine protein kinase [bacterium]
MSDQPTRPEADRVADLLFEWQLRGERGEAPAPAEACAGSPELAPEFARRAAAVRWVEGLFGGVGSSLVEFGPPPEPDDGPLPVLPGYGPLERIARGGMGVVYKARNLALDRVEAIKTVRPGEFSAPRELARFRFEAEAAASLAHPHIVTVYGVGEVAGRPYLAMRWVNGSCLTDHPRSTPAAEAALLAKVARAIHFAHQRGILHRDLKPGNVLVDAAGEPYVADFGLARPLDLNATTSGASIPLGTPGYMSPEQTRCEPRLTVGSDVFALGVVLYERLTGRPPFPGRTPYEVMERVRTAAPRPPGELNPAAGRDLEAVCLRCLEKDPADRYQGADELADDLDRYARGEPVAARPPGFWDWVRQLARTRPEPHPHYSWPVTVWFGAITLVAAAVVHWLVQSAGSATAVWAVQGAAGAGMAAVLWWYMLRRFRRLPPTERHSLIIAAGSVAVMLALTAAYVPPSADAPARLALGLYPPLMAACGLGLFVLGSTNWSRFFPIGVAVIALTPVTAWAGDAGPVLFGCVIAAVMWYWSYAKGVSFRGPVPGGE